MSMVGRRDSGGILERGRRWEFVRAAALEQLLDVSRPARRRLERHRRGELEAGFELRRALNLELWARTFLDG